MINAPAVVHKFWGLISGFIDAKTREKIKFFGEDFKGGAPPINGLYMNAAISLSYH